MTRKSSISPALTISSAAITSESNDSDGQRVGRAKGRGKVAKWREIAGSSTGIALTTTEQCNDWSICRLLYITRAEE